MELQIFRQELKSKIKRLEDVIDTPDHSDIDESIVRHQIYEIAIHIRKTIRRMPMFENENIKVMERKNNTWNDTNKTLLMILGRIIHYQYINFGSSVTRTKDKYNLFSAISDYDIKEKITSRIIETREFIEIAKKISTNDHLTAKYLSEYTLGIVKKTLKYYENNKQSPNQNGEDIPYPIGAGETIIDLMDLLRIKDDNFRENMEMLISIYEKENQKLLETISIEIKYNYLIKKFRIDYGIVLYYNVENPNIGYAVTLVPSHNTNIYEKIYNAIPIKYNLEHIYPNEKYMIYTYIKKDNIIKFFTNIKNFYK